MAKREEDFLDEITIPESLLGNRKIILHTNGSPSADFNGEDSTDIPSEDDPSAWGNGKMPFLV